VESLARSDLGLSRYRPFKVAIAGYYGFKNLGDELLAASLIASLEKSGVAKSEMVVLSNSPEESRMSFGTHAVNRWNLRDVMQTLSRSETLIFGGGGLFQDTTSLRSCLYYWGLLRMAKIAGCRSAALAQSIGPFRSRTGEILARNGLSLCEIRTVRDQRSLNLLHKWKLEGDLVFDLVMGLPIRENYDKPKVLLVNIRPWEGDLAVKTAKAAAKYAREHSLPIIGVGMAPEDEKLLRSFSATELLPCQEVRLVRNLRDIEDVWQLGGLAMGMRLHFCMISLLSGCPLVAVPYDPKVEAFAQEWEIPLFPQGDLPPLPWPYPCGKKLKRARKKCDESVRRAWKELNSHE
jgi:polysaccharide pyruvyl transferase CsaB